MRRRGFRAIVTVRVFRWPDERTTACLAMPDTGCVGYVLAPAGRVLPDRPGR